MKKLLISLFALFICGSLRAQDLSGSWLGSIALGGMNLHLGINFKKVSDTGYTATFDSPDQKAFGIPCSKVYRVKDSVFVDIAAVGGHYKGLWDGKDGLNGTFKQGMRELPLNMKRVTDAEKTAATKDAVRPQTPKPPYGYHTEDVEYDNADKSVHYGATFTRPDGEGKYPAVIIISGSGTQDRDGSMMGHKLYWVLADYLTKNGIAVLRVDDRGAGKSSTGGDVNKKTSVDFSYDVEAGLNYLETRADVNKKHLGLIGHSEGGMIAPMVAARRKDVSFIVLWGAPGVGGAKIVAAQNYYMLKRSGADSLALQGSSQLNQQVLPLFASSVDKQDFDKQLGVVFDNWKKAQIKTTLDNLRVHDHSIIGKDVFVLYNSLYDLPWMRFFISYDPAKDLSKVTCSVLAVNGAKDVQVNATDNLNRISEILTKSGNKDFKTVAIPNLNHFLQTADTGDVSEYEKIDETMSPAALNIICTWIKLHTK